MELCTDQNLCTNTVLDGSVILSVILFVCYRNEHEDNEHMDTFPLSNFKTKHIFGILMKRVKFLKAFGAPQVPTEKGRLRLPNFYYLSPPKVA